MPKSLAISYGEKADTGKRFIGGVEGFKEKRRKIERKMEKIIHHTMDEGPQLLRFYA